jgi:hypothetical protein
MSREQARTAGETQSQAAGMEPARWAVMVQRFLFVGERQSPTAAARGWTWESGRLCAATLFDALGAAHVDPAACRFVNIWSTPGLGKLNETPSLEDVRRQLADGYTVVALGRLVGQVLTAAGIPHLALRHPAARGAGRARERYRELVCTVLRGAA